MVKWFGILKQNTAASLVDSFKQELAWSDPPMPINMKNKILPLLPDLAQFIIDNPTGDSRQLITNDNAEEFVRKYRLHERWVDIIHDLGLIAGTGRPWFSEGNQEHGDTWESIYNMK